MTTAHGVPLPKHLRAAVHVLEHRRDYVAWRQAIYAACGWPPNEFFLAEFRALQLAIPALDAEADFASRFWKAQLALEQSRRHAPTHEDTLAAHGQVGP